LRIGTRITVTTSLLVAATLGVYGIVTLRSRQAELEAQTERQTREIAVALRVGIQARLTGNWEADAPALNEGLHRAGLPWEIALLDGTRPPAASAQGERLSRLLTARAPLSEVANVDGRRLFVHLEPIWMAVPGAPDRLMGALEVARDLAFVDRATSEEALRIGGSLIVLVMVLVLVVLYSTRRQIGKPIDKLLAGIDDVTKGDLSHVLLQEREDEIGALAARFNDMTQSLRDSQAETRRSVDDRLALEGRLRETSQLATIGQLAAEIAHEVGTPLNVVTGRARALAKKAEEPEAVHKNATIIAEQAARITRIIQRLLDVARRKVGEGERARVDLNRLGEGTIELLEYQLGSSRVEGRFRPLPGLSSIPGDRDQLQQVLLNLCMNAIQAMPEGGLLEVRLGRVARRRPGLERAPEQPYAYVEVIDTGVGIPEADRAKIFDAFYTSKSESGGTGLGLAVAHGIVKEHDGWIEVTPNDAAGRGTVFKVFLPLAAEA
jgi:signal transduction histidine kinase